MAKLNASKFTNRDILVTGTDPSTGEYLSAAQRKALFRKKKISSNQVFRKPGAIVKASPQMLRKSGALVKVGSSAITSDVDVNVLNARVIVVENQVSFLAKVLDKEAELDKKAQKDRENQALQEEERGLRSGKEKQLESGLFKALISPVKAVGGVAKGILQRLMEFFGLLLVGWLTDKGWKALAAWATGDNQKLEEIRNEVVKTLAIIGGIFLAMNGGIFSILGIIGGVIGAVGALGAKILSIAATAAAAIPGAAAVSTLAAGTAVAVGAGLATTKGVTDVARNIVTGGSKFREAQDRAAAKRQQAGISRRGNVLEKRGSRSVETSKERTPEQEKAWQEWQKETKRIDSLRDSMRKEIKIEVAKVKPTGIKTSGRDRGKPYFTAEDVSKKKEIEQQIRSKYEAMLLDPNAKPVVNPVAKTDLLKPKKENVDKERQAYLKWLDGRPDEFENQLEWETMKQNGRAPGFSAPAPAAPSIYSSSSPSIDSPSSPSMQIPGPVSSAGNTTVIYKKIGGSGQAQQQALKTGSATDVPLIASANPDNFYAIYSQLIYNVVI